MATLTNPPPRGSTASQVKSSAAHPDTEIPFLKAGRALLPQIMSLAKKRTALVGVYGLPNAGKTELIEWLAKTLQEKGIEVARAAGASRAEEFQELSSKLFVKNRVQFFHYADYRPPESVPAPSDDPDRLCREVLGRPLDMTIVLYNPSLHPKPDSARYDLVIRNKESRVK